MAEEHLFASSCDRYHCAVLSGFAKARLARVWHGPCLDLAAPIHRDTEARTRPAVGPPGTQIPVQAGRGHC